MGKPTVRRDRKKGSYSVKGKSPFRYSDTYNAWRAATLNGNTRRAAELDAEHRAKFLDRAI